MNKVQLIGNLTRDPETKTTPGGVSVCRFSIAVNRRHKNAQGVQETDFFNIVAWSKLAELCGTYLGKGRKAGISGSLQTRSYVSRDGVKRFVTEIVAEEVEFLTARSETVPASADDSAFALQEQGFPPADESELPY